MVGARVNRLLNRFGFHLIRVPAWNSLEASLKRVIQQHDIDTVVDIGANRGQFIRMLRSIGFQGMIISFEPNPACVSHLQDMTKSDRSLAIYGYGLGDIESELTLKVSNADDLSSFLDVNAFARTIWSDDTQIVRHITVPVRRLDDVMPEIIARHGIRKAICKVDTQGFDMKVIAGGSNVIRKFYALVTELPIRPIYQDMSSIRDALEQLRHFGFEVADLFPVSHSPEGYLVEVDCLAVNTDPE